MAFALPPSLYADFLVLRRSGWMTLARAIVAPALLVLGPVILIGASWYRGWAWCVPVSAMLALAGSYALVRARWTEVLVRSHFGWCGGLPVRPRVTVRAVLALTPVALVVAVLAASLLLVIAAIPAPHPGALRLALLVVDGGLAVGTAAAVVTVVRKGAVVRSYPADGIREPLFALRWLHGGPLPHLPDWQRRATLVAWRRGGSALIAVVLVAVPDSASIPKVVGLVLLVLSLVWLGVAMRACAKVTLDAAAVLGGTPLLASHMRSSSWRYPLVAVVCALALAVVGGWLMGNDIVAVAAWAACALATSAWPAVGIIKASHQECRA